MNPQTDNTGLGLPQPGSAPGQLPAIHSPQAFHAPDAAMPQFSAPVQVGSQQFAAPASMQPAISPVSTTVQTAPSPQSSSERLAAMNAQFTPTDTAIQDDSDTPFDEEWVVKAKAIVAQTHTDPFLQSRELSKLKAAYIKARYNKDIKVSEE